MDALPERCYLKTGVCFLGGTEMTKTFLQLSVRDSFPGACY